MKKLILFSSLLGVIVLSSACGPIKKASNSGCVLANGSPADCQTPGAQPRDPNGEQIGNCGPDFSNVYQTVLAAESDLDLRVTRCPSLNCTTTTRGEIRNSAVGLDRSAETMRHKYPSSTCSGRFIGGSKVVNGPVSTADEITRVMTKAQRYK